MKTIFCAVVALLALSLAACGGGGAPFNPPPPNGNFSDASLNGQYAFSMSGVDSGLCGTNPGAYIARVGSFIADGQGNITSGLEDVLDLGSGQAATVSFTSSHYSIQPNGRGLLTLQGTTGGGLQLNFVLQSNSAAAQSDFAGYHLQTDLCASSSGTFTLQNTADFSTTALSGHYVFDFSGLSFSASSSASSVAPISMVGVLNADGSGYITTGVMDTNDGNATAPSGPTAIPASTYQLDATYGTTFGRGTMTVNGRDFAFYIVDATHLKLLEEDNSGGTSGDALKQSGGIPAQNSEFTGSFVYLVGGSSVIGSQGPVARAARFTSDGNGGLGAISLDDNNDGAYTHISQGSNISNPGYAIDTTNAGSGRGTFTFADSAAGTFSDVFYMVSPTRAVVQETSNGIIGNGPLYAQTSGPFTVSASTGNYVFNWSGVELSSPPPFEEDFIGQYALSNATTNNISGVTDYVDLGLNGNHALMNVGLGGTLTIASDGTANNLYKFVLGNAPSTVNFQAYFANPSTVLLVCSDSSRATAGIIKQQTQ